jgi:hypothetical protein
MANKLRLVKGAAQRGVLIYGMQMFEPEQVAGCDRARVRLSDGTAGHVTMHVIEGTRANIRKQLMESIDAFFDLLEETSE